MDWSHLCEAMEVTKQQSTVNIFEAFRPLHRLLTLFGFAPFGVDVKDGSVYNRTIYYTAFIVLLYSTAFLLTCILGQQEPDAEESLLIRYGTYLLYLQYISIVIFVVVFNYVKRQTIANCLLVMHHFDCTMKVGQGDEL